MLRLGIVGEQAAALGGLVADRVLEVLDANGYPGEIADLLTPGQAFVDVGGGGERRLAVHGDEGVDGPVELLDPIEGVADDLSR